MILRITSSPPLRYLSPAGLSRHRPRNLTWAFVLTLDPALVSSVITEADSPALQSQSSVKAINVSPLDAELLDAVVRLVRLIDTPKEARFLTPLITREIIYRLLMGEQSSRLRYSLGRRQPPTHREAIARLHQEFDQPLRMEEMASKLGMSVSSFHHHFKEVTSMSPLQFQKHLRLQEARRLMLGERLDANSAGSRVGYDDTSHFNREYKSLFGVPPRRDVERLRATTWQTGDGGSIRRGAASSKALVPIPLRRTIWAIGTIARSPGQDESAPPYSLPRSCARRAR